MVVGQIREYDIKNGNWCAYCERLEMYFVANKIEDTIKLATLISVIGEEPYELLSTLASPKKPSELKYSEAVLLMKNHLQPKPSILAERYRFRQRRQSDGESVADYVAELKKMSKSCEFGATLEENLRDQLVCGIKSEVTRQRLFAEDDNITYSRAVKLAITLEAAERDAGAVEQRVNTSIDIHAVTGSHKCMTCGEEWHKTDNCKYKNYECSNCKRMGHLRRMCPTKSVAEYQPRRFENAAATRSADQSRFTNVTGGGRRARRGGRGRGHGPRAAAHWQQPAENPAGGAAGSGHYQYDTPRHSDADDEEPMYQMSLAKYKPVCMTMIVQNIALNMEIDTGSALSCINEITYRKYFSQLKVNPCQLKLKFYDGSETQPLGYLNVNVKYKNITKTLDLYVINSGTTTLLGRQWLSELSIDIPRVNVLKLESCRSDVNKHLHEIISRHELLFDGTLGRYTGAPVQLSVREGAAPVYCRARPVPYALRARVDAELDAMLAAGVIEPVERSDWATPLVIVSKANGGIRICADYKVTLNRVLSVDRYPVPKIDDLFSNLSGNVFFTKLDLSQAYNQLVLDTRSRAYTVINTHRGLFKYNRLVYGLASSPGIFQKLMVSLFKGLQDVIVFYDDILIKSKTLSEHLKTIEQVFKILQSSGLKIKKSKCEFLSKQVKYLGFIVNEDGVRVDRDKIKPILSMPPPTNISELKSFLGMVNFYAKFIPNLSSHLVPLYELLKKGRHYFWGKKQNDVFERVKQLLCSAEVLAHYDGAQQLVLTVDASARGLGAVLAQRTTDGRERVVAYASRTLSPAECHYSQIHKEALAIIFAVDKFHQYVYGRRFTLRTDHQPLVSIFGPNTGIPTTAASRLQRWAIKLSAYEFDIEYVSTDRNTADVLSRLIKTHKEDVVSTEQDLPEQTYLHFATDALLLDYKVIKKETANDPILSRVTSYITDGWPPGTEIRELKPFFNRKQELYCELGCIMWGQRVVIPSTCQTRVIRELHESHMGIVKTKALARSYVWWPGVDEAVEATCRACTVCAAVSAAPPAHTPRAWSWPDRPWTRLHIDFLGPIEGHSFLVVVDACSKWIEAVRMKTTNAKAVIAVFRDMWARFGLPKQVVSDNGPPFTSTEFETFLSRNGVEHIYSAPYHPASNGAGENGVKICKRAIKKACEQQLDIDTALNRFLLSYRNTEHYTTGESPAKILQGRNLRMRLDKLKPERSSRVAESQARVAAAAHGVTRQFTPGEEVWYRGYRPGQKWLEGKVVERLGTTDYRVSDSFGTESHRHIDQLKRRVSNGVAGIDIPPKQVSRRSSQLAFPVEEASGPQQVTNPEVVASPAEEAASVPSVPDNGVQLDSNVKRTRKPVVRYGFEELF